MNEQTTSQPESRKPINLLITPDIQKGVYSNVALIRHTQNEFIFDFILQFDGEAQLVSRVILSPAHTRAFKKALEDNLKKHEATFTKK